MSNLRLPNITDYASADEYLGANSYRKVAYATAILRNGTSIEVLHHSSPIVTYFPSGEIELDPWGWQSSTTVNRMNQLTPRHVMVNLRGTGSVNYDPRILVTVGDRVATLRGYQAATILPDGELIATNIEPVTAQQRIAS